eukprot:jgi/Mesvir1/29094/Mv18400-RA.1
MARARVLISLVRQKVRSADDVGISAGCWLRNVTTHAVSPVDSSVGTAARNATSWWSANPTALGIPQRIRHYVECYKELSKFRLSALVVSTAAAGFVLGSPETIDWASCAWTSFGTMASAASANAFNQVIEVRQDALMKRTMRRPLPSGRMSRAHALAFAVAAGVAGVGVLSYKANNLAASLSAANIFLYAGIYTPLKQIHMVNTWVGAVVGAVPPLIGWAAASGYLDAGAWVLAAGLYLWQIPHFMALAWLCRKDYAIGGYKMISLADATGRRTAAACLRNCFYMMPLGALAVHQGVTSHGFYYEAALISGVMALAASTFYHRPSTNAARLMFRASLLHLPVLMGAMLLHRMPHEPQGGERRSLLQMLPPSPADALSSLPVRLLAPHDSAAGSSKAAVVSHGAAGPGAAGSKEGETEEAGKGKGMAGSGSALPVLSAAPFPFLPIPSSRPRMRET